MTDGLTINVAGRELSIQDGTGAAKFTVDTDNGNTSIVGTLGVTSATTLSNTLNVVQGADFDSTVNIDGVTTLTDTTNSSTGNIPSLPLVLCKSLVVHLLLRTSSVAEDL